MTTDNELDDLLNSYTVAPATQGLQQRIMQTIDTRSAGAELLALLGGWRIAVPSLAASMLCGIAIQLWLAPMTTAIQSDTNIWALALLDTSGEWSDE